MALEVVLLMRGAASASFPESRLDGGAMPIVGENVGEWWAYTFDSSQLFSVTWGVDFPPRSGTAKVVLAKFFPFGGNAAIDSGVVDFRYRLPSGADSTVTLPDIDSLGGSTSVVWNAAMTHVTFGMKVREGSGQVLWTVENWA